MRLPGMLLLLFLILPSTAHADKWIMVCENVNGMRVDFSHSSKTFDEDKDGYSSSKHIIIFDEDHPNKVSAKWQTANPTELDREVVDQIMKDQFKDETIFRIDGLKVGTVESSGNSIYTAMYDFENLVVLMTRLRIGGLSDVAAYYKGRCERL